MFESSILRRVAAAAAVMAIAGTALVSGATPAAAAVPVVSDFTNNVDGWLVAGDTSSVAPHHVASGGNPGGYAHTEDSVAGGVMYWVAPSKFLGDRSGYAGGRLRFDLKQSATDSQFDASDVQLSNGGTVLEYNHSPNPATTWTSYTIPLSASGWTKAGSPATAADLATVLANVTDLRIRAEFRTGADSDGLDNVRLDPPPAPSVSVRDAIVDEGPAGTSVLLRFQVTLSAPTVEAVTVQWATANDTAVAPSDYVAASGGFRFQPGQTKKTALITVNGDDTYELLERLDFTLSSPTNATIGDGLALGRIRNDDATPTLSVLDASVIEGDPGAPTVLRFRVRLSAASGASTGFSYSTIPVSADTADFTPVAGTTSIPAGNDTKIVQVPVTGDMEVEPNETVSLQINSPVRATIADGEATGTILNDDGP